MLLVLALITSVIVWVVAAKAVVYGGAWVGRFVFLAMTFALILPLLTIVFTPSIILAAALFVPVLSRRMLITRRDRLLALGLPCLIAFAATAGLVWRDEHRLGRLRRDYPYVSMEDRLPQSVSLKEQAPVGEISLEQLSEIELALDEQPREAPWEERRSHMLKRLHENTLGLFIDSPGFGSTRMSGMRRPDENYLKGWPKPPIEPISQPSVRASSAAAEDESWKPQSVELDQYRLHRAGILAFIYPAGFGYFKDRLHVAGFKSHRFVEAPKVKEKWSISSVELVGLLLHLKPVVYLSPHLPNMEELRGAPKRPPDRFETAGLEAIKKGEDLFVGETPAGVRMMGAIRSAKQCLQCHEGTRGDLLGAFSYRLEKYSN